MQPKVMVLSHPKMEEKISSFIIPKLKAAMIMRRLMMGKKLSLKLVKARKAHVQIMSYPSKYSAHNRDRKGFFSPPSHNTRHTG